MITALDHIAIAVPDFQRAIDKLVEDFGLTCTGVEHVESAQTTTAFFPLPPTQIELIHPLNGGGPVAKFLTKSSGLHHLCFRTNDIINDVARLKEKGYQFLSETPYKGAHDCLVIFIHPKSCDGVLIELSQPS